MQTWFGGELNIGLLKPTFQKWNELVKAPKIPSAVFIDFSQTHNFFKLTYTICPLPMREMAIPVLSTAWPNRCILVGPNFVLSLLTSSSYCLSPNKMKRAQPNFLQSPAIRLIWIWSQPTTLRGRTLRQNWNEQMPKTGCCVNY